MEASVCNSVLSFSNCHVCAPSFTNVPKHSLVAATSFRSKSFLKLSLRGYSSTGAQRSDSTGRRWNVRAAQDEDGVDSEVSTSTSQTPIPGSDKRAKGAYFRLTPQTWLELSTQSFTALEASKLETFLYTGNVNGSLVIAMRDKRWLSDAMWGTALWLVASSEVKGLLQVIFMFIRDVCLHVNTFTGICSCLRVDVQSPWPVDALWVGCAAKAEQEKGQNTARVTGAVAVLLGVAYLVLVQLLDTRGVILVPPPPEAFDP